MEWLYLVAAFLLLLAGLLLITDWKD